MSIPPEILNKTTDPATLLRYYLDHLEGQKYPLNEAKMVLVGQANVGKTSLVNRLVEDSFDPLESTTLGIDIRPWQILVNDAHVQLNVWDFGGQEIMHATHQFFLTRRTLYVLVIDTRMGEEENRLEYWLKIIRSFGGESPVIVVGNKIDQAKLDIDRRGLMSKYPISFRSSSNSASSSARWSPGRSLPSYDVPGARSSAPWPHVSCRCAIRARRGWPPPAQMFASPA
jgi:internalin A